MIVNSSNKLSLSIAKSKSVILFAAVSLIAHCGLLQALGFRLRSLSWAEVQRLFAWGSVCQFYLGRNSNTCLKSLIELLEMLSQQKKTSAVCFQENGQGDTRRSGWRREKLSGPSIFIAKTYEILEGGQYADVVCWNQEGTSFTILDVDKFEQQILPVYFRHRNFSSFVRQLNMYDFHKIRNQLNRNIFEHREFRTGAKHLLKNIKRKGCLSRKSIQQSEAGHSFEQYTPDDNCFQEEKPEEEVRSTLAVIDNRSQLQLLRNRESPHKLQMMQDFIAGLPQVVESEQQVKEIIRSMKRDSRYRCLSSKEDVRRIVSKIRRNRMVNNNADGLQELSIEEEIMVQNVDDREQRAPTMLNLSTENCLPRKSQGLICSLILCEEAHPKNPAV